MQKRRTKEPKVHERATKIVDELSEISPDIIATAIADEEPLPLVIAEMALWGAGMSALMLPIGMMGLIAAPFAAIGNILRRAPQAA